MQEVINVNNGLIVMTSTHPIMTTNGWAALNDEAKKLQDKEMQIELKIGSEIVFADGETVAVSDIFKQYIPVRVYSIKVDNDHTYIANGIITHNK